MSGSLTLPFRPRRADERPAPTVRTAPQAPRPRGPVLIGDLSANIAGRPLWLMHWDEDRGDD